MRKKIVVVIIPAINNTFVELFKKEFPESKFIYNSFSPPFCALTLPVQASLFTGKLPSQTGVVANGVFNREFQTITFWNQSHSLIEVDNFWKSRNLKVALIFMQMSLGSNADIIITPKPIHKHHGGMIDFCYTYPYDLYPSLVSLFGAFKLKWYWGPFVSIKASQWIKDATIYILKNYTPDIAFTYIPHMDYISQKIGYGDIYTTSKELRKVIIILKELQDITEVLGYDLIIFSDYGACYVNKVYYPNKLLREQKLLNVFNVKKYNYFDIYTSNAFALCDHQICYIFCKKEEVVGEVATLFKDKYPSVQVLTKEELLERKLYHPNMGDIALFAKDGWFSYKWWNSNEYGPDYKDKIDIHRKEGYDPTELFMDWWKLGISQDDALVKMSMGNGFLNESKGIFLARLTYNTEFFTLRKEISTIDIVNYLLSLFR
jgi:predicted AlkP superfamily pyrophosphatase or phosphodiesterase